MRVLVVPDKFKGTLTARQGARAIALGWKRARPHDSLDLLPMSDGGDGFGSVIGALMGARRRTTITEDAAHQPRRANWWLDTTSRTAIIESSEAIGLALLPSDAPHPFERDTTGLGRLLAAVARQRPKRCMIGIGGSATNDAGFGLAREVGWKFLGQSGKELRQWTELDACVEIEPPQRQLPLGHLTVAVDVDNRLLGPRGCTRVYGPQKGMRPRDFARSERCLDRLARLMERASGKPLHKLPGAGAAGGLGFGLMAFLDARPASGFALFARLSRLRRHIRRSDLVITGEGCLDAQSSMGKGSGSVAAWCRQERKPCIALVGIETVDSDSGGVFDNTFPLAPDFTSEDEAMRRPALHLARLATHIAARRLWT